MVKNASKSEITNWFKNLDSYGRDYLSNLMFKKDAKNLTPSEIETLYYKSVR